MIVPRSISPVTTKEMNKNIQIHMQGRIRRGVKRKAKSAFNLSMKKRMKSLRTRNQKTIRKLQKFRQKADSNDFTRSSEEAHIKLFTKASTWRLA